MNASLLGFAGSPMQCIYVVVYLSPCHFPAAGEADPVGVHHAGNDGACAIVHEIRFLSGEPPSQGLCCMNDSLEIKLLATFNE
jgi:hypothetical protein